MSAETPFDTKDFARITQDLLAAARQADVPVDDYEGSVARTLLEAFARELAVCYEQLRQVYRFGYLDSADGSALDKVVALLGLERHRAGHVEGQVTFLRGQAAPQDIPIPPGTLLAGRDVALFETVEPDAAIRQGTLETTVRVRSVEPGSDAVPPHRITLMPRPIWGVDGVDNRAELAPTQAQEGDVQLRARARSQLDRVKTGTVDALSQAVRSLGVAEASIRENPQIPGDVTVVLGDPDIDDALVAEVREALQRVRPAGVRLNVAAAERVVVQVAATLVLREDYRDEDRRRIRADLEAALQAYFGALKIGELVRMAKVQAILAAVAEVAEVQALSGRPRLSAWLPRAGQPDTLADVTARYALHNGDLQFETGQRGTLDLERRPLLLNLEAPAPEVWVDVAFVPALSADQETAVRQGLQVQLDTFKPGEALDFARLQGGLPQLAVGQVVQRFTLIHRKDNSVVTLAAGQPQTDTLRERERARVGRLVAGETSHG
jgi:uncharacterized phage protein gp47/JayE